MKHVEKSRKKRDMLKNHKKKYRYSVVHLSRVLWYPFVRISSDSDIELVDHIHNRSLFHKKRFFRNWSHTSLQSSPQKGVRERKETPETQARAPESELVRAATIDGGVSKASSELERLVDVRHGPPMFIGMRQTLQGKKLEKYQ